MVYVFDDFDSITEAEFQLLLKCAGKDRRVKVLKYKFREDQVLSLVGYHAINYAVGGFPILEYGLYGKPYVSEDFDGAFKHFNMSHCRMCVAVVADDVPVGIDVEEIREFDPGVMKLCFTDFEKQQVMESSHPEDSFYLIWTLKESYIKAIGKGMSFHFLSVEFDCREEVPRCSDKAFQFESFVYKEKYRISCCYKDKN